MCQQFDILFIGAWHMVVINSAIYVVGGKEAANIKMKSICVVLLLSFTVRGGMSEAKCPKNKTDVCHFYIYEGRCAYGCVNMNAFPIIGLRIGGAIQEIVLGDSNITSIHQSDFTTLPNVIVVNVHYCNLHTVAKGTFSKLQKLQYLTLSWNPLTLQAMTNTFCSLPQNSLDLNVTLKGIFETDVKVSFPPLMLKCLEQRNITTLDLSVNMLSAGNIHSVFCATNRTVQNYLLTDVTWVDPLPCNQWLFECFDGIRINLISLTTNALSCITEDSFIHLSHISCLDISGCEASRHIRQMHTIGKLKSLTQLNLGQNNFRDFSVFANCSQGVLEKLELLDLTKNLFLKLSAFSPHIFPSLHTLDISGTIPRLQYIPHKFIFNLPSLRTIRINNLELVRLSDNPFYSDSLATIEMEYMQISISEISIDIFRNIKKLKTISMEGLNSGPIYSGGNNYYPLLDGFLTKAFRNLTSLTHLNLKSVGMDKLYRGMFTGTQKLSQLDLSSNHIFQLYEGSINHLNQLTVLILDHNSIASLNASVLPQPENQMNISIHFNSWNCDCSILWFLQVIQINIPSKIHLSGENDYICHSPSYMAGVKVKNFHPSQHKCFSNPLASTYFIMLYTSVSLLATLMVASFAFRLRWHIYFAYINTKARIRGYKELNDPREYEYDAFVAYNRDDTKWVTGHLRTVLEKQNKLKLCLHDRDWLAGVDIVENIQQSIDWSRKVVLIITNAFARSNWCQLELTMAQHRLFSEDKDNLILVMKEKILDCNMTPRLALQLKTQTYIEWDESEMGQKVFWTRLVKATRGPAASVRNKPVIH